MGVFRIHCWQIFLYRYAKRHYCRYHFHRRIRSNKAVTIKDIQKTILYDKDGNKLATIDGGYLDIGIQDTMEDLFVNLIGAVTFSILGYCYILNKKKYKFIRKFIPMKTADYQKYIDKKYTKKTDKQ